ncbi:MAG: histidine phosphatase family protein [Dehalococcoidales bacterium]|nr:histidine phosphatase family protein [Dehalococcoidales bacterium]
MARLLLVRHGETEYNVLHKIQGHTDIDLNEKGIRQVEKVGERLAGEKIDIVYSSDLTRAVDTARAAINSHDLEIRKTPEIREMDYGLAEGMTYTELKESYPSIATSIFDFDLSISFPEGETFMDFVNRGTEFLDDLLSRSEDQTVLIVSHGGMIKAMICHLLGIEQTHWTQIRIDNASLSIADTYGDRVILSLMNDTSYLGDYKSEY